METYGMAAPLNDNAIDCYHQYVAQTGYRCEQPEDGDHLKAYSDNLLDEYRRPQHSWYLQRSRNVQQEPESYREADYRSPPRNVFNLNRYNPRNGLYIPEVRRRGGGDHYSLLPGNATACNPYDSNMICPSLGGYERNAWQRSQSPNRWF